MTTYLEEIAEAIRRRVPEEALPEGDSEALFLTYAVLALGKGMDVTPADVHNAWSAWMLARGEGHESVVPFHELDPAVQREDTPFVRAIRAVAAELEL